MFIYFQLKLNAIMNPFKNKNVLNIILFHTPKPMDKYSHEGRHFAVSLKTNEDFPGNGRFISLSVFIKYAKWTIKDANLHILFSSFKMFTNWALRCIKHVASSARNFVNRAKALSQDNGQIIFSITQHIVLLIRHFSSWLAHVYEKRNGIFWNFLLYLYFLTVVHHCDFHCLCIISAKYKQLSYGNSVDKNNYHPFIP